MPSRGRTLGPGKWVRRGTAGTDRQVLGGVTFAASVSKKQGT